MTGAAYLPFLIAGWKTTPVMLKRLAIFLLVVLFASNLLFGWLRETRNWMPLIFVLAVIAGRYVATLSTDQTDSVDSLRSCPTQP